MSTPALLLEKVVLGPVLLAQGRAVRRTAVRLPEACGPREGIEAPDAPEAGRVLAPLGLLFVGDSSAAGVGVTGQSEAWAQPSARAVAARLGQPVRWQLVAQSGLDAKGALALVRSMKAQPIHAAAFALGVNDVTAQSGARQFRADMRALLDHVRSQWKGQRAVLVGVPPMQCFTALPRPLRGYLGRYARRLDDELALLASEDPGISHLRILPPERPVEGDLAVDGYHPGPLQYRRMAGATAADIVRLLTAPSLP